MIIIDAKDKIVGRIAVIASKHALLGQDVMIINSEKAVISGDPEHTFAKYKNAYTRGVPKKGPYMSRMPDRLVRRMVRGMLPMDKARGKEAFARVMCYIGTPDDLKGKETINIAGADSAKLPTLKKISVAELSKLLGARWNE